MKGRLENQIKIEAKIEDLLSHNNEIFQQFLLNLSTNTAKTKHQYLLSILYFFEHCNKLNPRKVSLQKLSSISKADIQRFLEKDKYYTATNGETRLKSPATVARQIAVLKNFFQFCQREGYITDDPTRDIKNPKKNNETEVVYMTPEEIERVKDNIRKCEGPTDRVEHIYRDWESRDLAIFTLGCTTGLRVTAISEINVEDVDLDNLTISVTEKGNKERTIYIGRNTAEQLRIWLRDREVLLDDRDMDSDALFISARRTRISSRQIAEIIKRNTKDLGKHITPHKMRSSCATNLYAKTNNIYLVKDVLGHSNIANTQRYTRQSQSKLKQAADILDNI